MNEKTLQQKLHYWLETKFLKSTSHLIKEDVNFKVEDFCFRADLIAIKSKSNVIHGFEIKNRINQSDIASAISQVFSYYTNYKWLVVNQSIIANVSQIQIDNISKTGIGIITYKNNSDDFNILIESKYIDGNFLKYIPDMKLDWENKTRTSKN
jgi:hypothetical protein